jgi:hypothetical protein
VARGANLCCQSWNGDAAIETSPRPQQGRHRCSRSGASVVRQERDFFPKRTNYQEFQISSLPIQLKQRRCQAGQIQVQVPGSLGAECAWLAVQGVRLAGPLAYMLETRRMKHTLSKSDSLKLKAKYWHFAYSRWGKGCASSS